MGKKKRVFETTFETYVAEEVIGEGATGRVFRVVDQDGNPRAIKLLDHRVASSERRKRFKNELTFGFQSRHRNVLTVLDHGVFAEGDAKTPFYVMPLYSASLRTLIESRRSAAHVERYIAQLCDGLEAAHLLGVVHRDLKPENVLYDDHEDLLVLADFGIARFQQEELYTTVETGPRTRLANFQYAAPEQRVRNADVDARADLFALGLILHEMATGQVPHGTGYGSVAAVLPEVAYLDAVVERLIRHDPAERFPSVEEMKAELIRGRNQHVVRQEVEATHEQVVPTTEVTDPLVLDPVRLVSVDWDRGRLTLVLSQPVTPAWVDALKNMGSHTSVMGKGPERFQFKGDSAFIDAGEGDAQRVIDYFKEWLPKANERYARDVRARKDKAERAAREELERQAGELEQRERMLRNLEV